MTKEKPIRRVGIVARPESADAVRTARELADWLSRRDIEVDLDAKVVESAPAGHETGVFDTTVSYDLVVALGGDGTLLAVARGLAPDVPILGVNLGNLGFLTEMNRTELYPGIISILAGGYSLERRSMLDVELVRSTGECVTFRILNDAVIAKSALSRIIELKVSIDGLETGRYRADGLIVSTPTGSTAYNLSAGGPIINPLLQVAILTPICPHTLSLRPLVVPDTSLIEVRLETSLEKVFLTLDGQEGVSLGFRDVVRLRRARSGVTLVRATQRSFYDSLRDKLHWGGDSMSAQRSAGSD